MAKKIWPKVQKKKNLNPEIRRLEQAEEQPKPLLTEQIRKRLNEPYSVKSSIHKAHQEVIKEYGGSQLKDKRNLNPVIRSKEPSSVTQGRERQKKLSKKNGKTAS